MAGTLRKISGELPTVGSFMREFLRFAGWRAFFSLLLIGLSATTQGAGLLLLLPMVHLIGIGGTGAEGPAALVAGVFGFFGLELTLPVVLLSFVVLIGLNSLLMFVVELLNASLNSGFMHRIRVGLYRMVTDMSWSMYTRIKASDINNAITIEAQQVGVATSTILQLAVLMIICTAYIGVSFFISVPVTVVSLFCALGLLLLLWPLNVYSLRSGTGKQRGMLTMFDELKEQLGGFKVAKSYSLEGEQLRRFERASSAVRDRMIEFTRLYSGAHMLFQFGAAVMLALLFYYAVAEAGTDSAAVIVIVFLYARIMRMFTRIQQLTQQLSNHLPAFRAISALKKKLEEGAENLGPSTGQPLKLEKEIRLRDVSFAYDQGAEVLTRVNLDIGAGEFLAVVGRSGEGKTTLLDLIMGLLTPAEGTIEVDGARLDSSMLADWRRAIGYVPQETFLFDDTLENNLRWARPGAKEQELWRALEEASASEFVRSLPEGLRTMVGSNGVRLSGGERQRLALARALLREPSILVLDEPTSSLDPRNEANVRSAIEALKGRITMIVIAHRPTTIRRADRVLAIEGGMVRDLGPWEGMEPGMRKWLEHMEPEEGRE